MANMLEVVIEALKWAKENECTRFPEGNGYKGEGFSALEAVNKALTENEIPNPKGGILQLNKGQLTNILNTNEMKEAGLTRFDGINDLRKARGGSGLDVLNMFGLTAAPKQPRTKKDAAEATTTATPAASEVATPSAPQETAIDDFDDL